MIINVLRNFFRWVAVFMLAGWVPWRPMVRVEELEELEEEPRRVDPPIAEIPASIEVYPKDERFQLRGFGGCTTKRLQCELDRFHSNMQPRLRAIVENNRYYRIHLEETRFGDGIFNGTRRIPRGTSIAFYVSCITYHTQYERDKDATYGFSIDPMFTSTYVCMLDGKFFISNRQPYNASFLNHSCRPNCYAETVSDDETKVLFLQFITTRIIQAGEQLFIDYNYRKPLMAGDGYWQHISLLAHVPEYRLVRCGCANPCPKLRAYDIKDMRPLEAAALEAAM
jgi:hypothetical protein